MSSIGGDILISTTEVFDPGTNSWETLSPLPTQRVSVGCTAIGDLIYVIGGWDEHYKATSIVLEGKPVLLFR